MKDYSRGNLNRMVTSVLHITVAELAVFRGFGPLVCWWHIQLALVVRRMIGSLRVSEGDAARARVATVQQTKSESGLESEACKWEMERFWNNWGVNIEMPLPPTTQLLPSRTTRVLPSVKIGYVFRELFANPRIFSPLVLNVLLPMLAHLKHLSSARYSTSTPRCVHLIDEAT